MLREREKRVLAIGGAAAALIFALTFIVLPGISSLKSNARALAAAETDLQEVRRVRPELERAQAGARRKAALVQASANSKESPLSRLSSAIQEGGVPQSAFSVKSGGARDGEFFREESFDVRMENLTYLEAVKAISARFSRGSTPTSPGRSIRPRWWRRSRASWSELSRGPGAAPRRRAEPSGASPPLRFARRCAPCRFLVRL